MKVTVCLIATKKYKIFIIPLVESIKRYFLLRHEIEIVLFTDDIHTPCEGNERVKITKDLIVSLGFPEATLKRFEIMTSRAYECDYIYYLDIDYLIISEVDENIFGDGLVAVLHPGFSFAGGGSWCTDEDSNAFTFPENRLQYFCGGTSGGKYKHYYKAMRQMKLMIEDDEKRGVRAEHNDESHWNRLLSEHKSFKILDSSYCMPEPFHLRAAWGLTHLVPKILALDKNHEEIRK